MKWFFGAVFSVQSRVEPILGIYMVPWESYWNKNRYYASLMVMGKVNWEWERIKTSHFPFSAQAQKPTLHTDG